MIPVREPGRHLAHQRPLAAIPIATGAEHDVQLARRVRPQCGQQPFQRVRRVRVVDIGGRAVRQLRRQLHAAANALQPRQEVKHRVQAQHERQTGGHQNVIGLEPAGQVQPNLTPRTRRESPPASSGLPRQSWPSGHGTASIRRNSEPASPTV